MKKIFIITVILIFGILYISEIAFAQFRRIPKQTKSFRTKKEFRIKEKKENPFKELKLDIEDWTKDNLLSEFIVLKNKLDSGINIGDLKTLDSLRYKMAALNEELNKIRKSKDKEFKKSESEIIKYDRKDVIDAAKPLRLKYKILLDSIYSEAQPNIQKWETAASDFIIKWTEERKYNLTDKEKMALENYYKYDEKFKGARFLLWNRKSVIW
jgi:hypothetical protein